MQIKEEAGSKSGEGEPSWGPGRRRLLRLLINFQFLLTVFVEQFDVSLRPPLFQPGPFNVSLLKRTDQTVVQVTSIVVRAGESQQNHNTMNLPCLC